MFILAAMKSSKPKHDVCSCPHMKSNVSMNKAFLAEFHCIHSAQFQSRVQDLLKADVKCGRATSDNLLHYLQCSHQFLVLLSAGQDSGEPNGVSDMKHHGLYQSDWRTTGSINLCPTA